MTTTTVRKPASRRPRAAQPTRPERVPNPNRPKGSTEMTVNPIQLLHEALSRARTPRPQDTTAEANRSARQIAIRVRREQSRQLGV
jgi:hypothetical protein